MVYRLVSVLLLVALFTVPAYAVEQTIALDAGFNFVSLDVTPDAPITSSSLLLAYPGITQIFRFDKAKQGFEYKLRLAGTNFFGNDFTLEAGQGCVIKSTGALTFPVSGTAFAGDPLPALTDGFNFVGMQAYAGTYVHALLAARSELTSLFRWKKDPGLFAFVIKLTGGSSLFGEDFAVEKGTGYFIRATGPSEAPPTDSTRKSIDLGGGVTMTFRMCPAGSFQMGSPDTEVNREPNEGPVHSVTLTNGFWMAETECTQAQWQAVMGNNPSQFTGDVNRPVEMVSWNDCQSFMNALNVKVAGQGTFRLPTEAEWEYAARAGTRTAYPWGDVMDAAYVASSTTQFGSTQPVKQRLPNTFGLYDMIGNVLEFCGDWYSASYYTSGLLIDPTGPATGTSRTARGGGFTHPYQICRAATRYGLGLEPVYSGNDLGFRAVLAGSTTLPPATVATPTFDPAGGSFNTAQNVTIDCSTPGATIRFTTDNSTPSSTNGFIYTVPIPITATATIKAYATKAGMTDSAVVTVALTIQPVEVHTPGERKTIDLGGGIAMNLRWCPAGSFQMGSPDSEPGRNAGEGPVHAVTFTKGFWMAESECTQTQWQAVMGNNPARVYAEANYGVGTTLGVGPEFPIYAVSWNDVAGPNGFIGRLNSRVTGEGNFRLPTEAEWEYGCRAGSTTTFYWGASWNDAYGWYSLNRGVGQWPSVKSKTPNAWSLYDMSGGVWEWCADVYDPSYYAGGSMTDPQGSGSGSGRVFRGGSLGDEVGFCRSAFRGWSAPETTYGIGGFRTVLASGQPNPNLFVATPTFNPPAGGFTTAQNISIICATSGATIRFTNDGSTPSASNGFDFTVPIPVATPTTIKAYATKAGMTDSAVETATYDIAPVPLASLTLAVPGLDVNKGTEFDLATMTGTVSYTDGRTQPATGLQWALSTGVGSLVGSVYTATAIGDATLTATYTDPRQAGSVTATFAIKVVPAFFEVTTQAGVAINQEAVINNAPVTLNVPDGTFDEPTKMVLWTPDSNVLIPKYMPESVHSTGTNVGVTFDANIVNKDIQIELMIPADLQNDKLVVTYYDGENQIPLQVTNIISSSQKSPKRSPNRTISEFFDNQWKYITVTIPNNVVNTTTKVVNKINSTAEKVVNGAVNLANKVVDGVITVGESIVDFTNGVIKPYGEIWEYKYNWYKIMDGNDIISNYKNDFIIDNKYYTVIIVHGIFSNPDEFSKLANYLSNTKKFNVLGFRYNYFLSIRENGEALNLVLNQISSSLIGRKVYVVAHSMGGLVSRWAIKSGSDNYIDKLVMLSSPNIGARSWISLSKVLAEYSFPCVASLDALPSGFVQLLPTTFAGATLFQELDSNWGIVKTNYFGIIHESDYFVSPESWGIFKNSGMHETPKNGNWNWDYKSDFITVNNDKIKIILNSEVPINPLNPLMITYTHGSSHQNLVSQEKIAEFLGSSLISNIEPIVKINSQVTDVIVTKGEIVTINYTLTDPDSAKLNLSLGYNKSGSITNVWFPSTYIVQKAPGLYSLKWDTTPLTEGTYQLCATVFDGVTSTSGSSSGKITVRLPTVTTPDVTSSVSNTTVPTTTSSIVRDIDLGGGVMMKFCWISTKDFQMGSPSTEAGHLTREEPVHDVSLTDGYWLAETECTQAQWLALMPTNPSYYKGDLQRPVETVSWNDCQAFMDAANAKNLGVDDYRLFRLPTEAEWEFACRAGTTTAYPWGDAISATNCWYSANAAGTPRPVRQKSPNPWGLYDMNGGVWEWCADSYDAYPTGAVTNPQITGGSNRVIRGGSYADAASICRSAYRSNSAPTFAATTRGFRPVLAYGHPAVQTTRPTVTITSQSVNQIKTSGDTVQIDYTLTDPDSDRVYLSIGYNKATSTTYGTTWLPEVSRVLVNPGQGSYYWNTTGIAPGDYYINAGVDDGGTPTVARSVATVTIQPVPTPQTALPVILLTSPLSNEAVKQGANVTIRYTISDPLNRAVVLNLGYDSNDDYDTGQSWIASLSGLQKAPGFSYESVWNTTGVPAGVYSIIASVQFGSEPPVYMHSPGKVTVYTASQSFGGSVGSSPGAKMNVDLGGGQSMSFCWIPKGAFRMGSSSLEPENDPWSEAPLHTVILTNGFWMAETECTQAQWLAVMGSNPSAFTGDALRPVDQISYDDCMSFVSAMNGKNLGVGLFRLPTDAEWEFACRAGTSTAYPWGDTLDGAYAWFRSNAGSTTHPVGGKPANAWGLRDMIGNVGEWCADGMRKYADGMVTDPSGPAEDARVVRGGAYYMSTGLRSAKRTLFCRRQKENSFGMRLVIALGSVSGPTSRPLVNFNSNDANVSIAQGQPFSVDYVITDPDSSTVTFNLGYDTDRDPSAGTTWLPGLANVSRTPNAYTAVWDTTTTPLGSYYLVARAHDGVDPACFAVSLGRVTIVNARPTVQITSQGKDVSGTTGQSVRIEYEINDPDTPSVSLSLGCIPASNLSASPVWISGMENVARGMGTAFETWDTTGFAPGEYYLVASVSDGVGAPGTSRSIGKLTLISPGGASSDWSAGETMQLILGDGVTMTFCWVPSTGLQDFHMGSPDEEHPNNSAEGPVHSVVISKGYWMAETECTQAQWQKIMGTSPASGNGAGPDYPVYNVSWTECQNFMTAINNLNLGYGMFRLPAEAEWEYACRAGTQTAYYWGAAKNNAYGWWYEPNVSASTHPVKQKLPNNFGLYDMSGNVQEWCSDFFPSSYTTEPVVDPQGSASGWARAARGGCWVYDADYSRSAYRYCDDPSGRRSFIGFRPVLVPVPNMKQMVRPTVQFNNITTNTSVVAGSTVTIDYTVTDPDNANVIFSLGIDTNTDNTSGHTLFPDTDTVSKNPGHYTYDWNVTGYPAGTYYIFASVHDKMAPIVYTHSVGTVRLMTALEKIPLPTFSSVTNSYNVPQNVTITADPPDSTIRYTLDGTIPDATHGTVYANPIPVNSTKTIKAYATRFGMTESDVATATITILNPPTVTTFFPLDNALDAPTSLNPTLTFNTPVVKGTGNIYIKKVSDNTTKWSNPVGDATIVITGSTVTINTGLPVPPFASSTEYYILVDGTCFKDANGKEFAGITDNTGWNFKAVNVPGANLINVSNNAGYRNGGRGSSAIIYNGKMWLIGGMDTYRGDVWWSLDGVTWTAATTSGAFENYIIDSQALVYDNKMWVIGRYSAFSSTDGTNWTEVTTQAGFGERAGLTALAFNGKMWVIGGAGNGNEKNDVWSSVDGITWTLVTEHAAFPARSWHSSVVFNGKMWIIGGRTANSSYGDVWCSSDGLNWTLQSDSKFTSIIDHKCEVYDNKLWIIGGNVAIQGNNYSNVIWSSSNGIDWNCNYMSPIIITYASTCIYDNALWIFERTFGPCVWKSQ